MVLMEYLDKCYFYAMTRPFTPQNNLRKYFINCHIFRYVEIC